ncbi:alcohol dehydrogenase catalytic domain-containing protein [Natronococcus jeotgali]|uniref:Alcohol dehydrogenase n=1 Tax=Natronococcus jeotgali DSM 18795 TaxID=1227498 RepID=L9XK94_9EURY|nr:Zn-dependent alcohol dehydrogenase [Natronococcus jeotgali]ELY61987.1 alcohol dehydrogenase [Natronococcus jeotgali DSM 18795]
MTEITAAVLEGPRDLSIESIELAEPKADEVRVDLKATGVCHTDHHRYVGTSDAPYPIVLGHEGAGVVDAVGENVTSVEPGDHVVLWVLPFCRECAFCERGDPHLCSRRSAVKGGTLLDGTRRLSRGEEKVNHFYGQSSFASHCVVAEQTAVKIPESLPFPEASLLGCGAITGLGAVVNTADVSIGEPAAVFGCGGVGSSAILGASLAGANPIIAVDIEDETLATVADLGATHTINSSETDPVREISRLTDGGVKYAFECTSIPGVIEQAVEAVQPGGTVVATTTSSADPLQIAPGELTYGKRIVGNVGGSAQPSIDIPRFATLAQSGRLPLEKLVSQTYSLDQLDEAFEAIENGNGIRGVVTYE